MSSNDTYEHKKYIFCSSKEWSRQDKKLCGENFKYIFLFFLLFSRYIDTHPRKEYKIIFIIEVNTFRGMWFWSVIERVSREAKAKRMMEISMQIYIKKNDWRAEDMIVWENIPREVNGVKW